MPIPRPEGHPALRLTRVLEPGNVLTVEPGLYFIGEVVDVTGHLGGFNFQWADSGQAETWRTLLTRISLGDFQEIAFALAGFGLAA